MKKILLATTLLVALTSAVFADGKNSNAKLINDLKTALKNVNQSAWQTTENYKKTQFALNGKNVSAFVSTETNDLIGFGIDIDANALPQGTQKNVAKKFKGWQIINSIMFIDDSGNVSYYVQVSKDLHSLALSVSEKGKVSIYSRMLQ